MPARRGKMADRRGLGFIGWAFGAVTATVIAISGLVVTASVPQADAASSVTLSAATR
jgi:hypothetical protein